MGEIAAVPRSPSGRPRGAKRASAKAAPPPTRKDQLLDAAIGLFSKRNYSSVTIKDIATATAANASLIYYYFGSKEGLFRAVVEALTERAHQTFEAVRGQAMSPEEVVGLWISNQGMQLPLMRKLFMIGIDYANAHKRSAQIDRAIRRLYDIEAEVLGQAIRDGMQDGSFVRVDIDKTVAYISTFLDGALAHTAVMPQYDARGTILRFRTLVLDQLCGRPVSHL